MSDQNLDCLNKYMYLHNPQEKAPAPTIPMIALDAQCPNPPNLEETLNPKP